MVVGPTVLMTLPEASYSYVVTSPPGSVFVSGNWRAAFHVVVVFSPLVSSEYLPRKSEGSDAMVVSVPLMPGSDIAMVPSDG